MNNLRCMHGVPFPAFCDKCNPQHGTGKVEMIHDPAIVMERNASAGEVPDVRKNRTSEPLSNSEQLVKPEMPERRIEMDIKIAREIAARIWCDQEMRSVEMDSTLCERIAQLLAGSDLAVEREKVKEEANG